MSSSLIVRHLSITEFSDSPKNIDEFLSCVKVRRNGKLISLMDNKFSSKRFLHLSFDSIFQFETTFQCRFRAIFRQLSTVYILFIRTSTASYLLLIRVHPNKSTSIYNRRQKINELLSGPLPKTPEDIPATPPKLLPSVAPFMPPVTQPKEIVQFASADVSEDEFDRIVARGLDSEC